ncbi:proprotein convertase subtilisin/kexin type 4-like [Coregonus clupeaformis]|uniref:proprotein convertase subtilisin/kexin type 4-like n=1 Tax=Coregonus clupeaformis TaxID=59861 RepID=UPI001BDFA3A1|nr:proprotein convertase subtilisin/kexin type 4-like [Coregonus clupeaformis]
MRYLYISCSLCMVYMCTIYAEVIYTNSWALYLSGTPEQINKIAKKHGFHILGKIFPDGNYYHMEQPGVAKQSLQAHYLHNLRLKMDPKVLWFAQQSGRIRNRRHSFTAPTDPFFNQQWYLSEAFDQNVVAAWARGYTGKGVVVSILDDGLETSHPDLAENYDPLASYDMNDNDPIPDTQYSLTRPKRHGTRCAGVVAAVANNGVCGVGVAYQAKIGGVRMLDGQVTDLIEAMSLNLNQQHIDIYSSSWGPEDLGRNLEGPNTLAQEAFIRGISNGRGGLGSIYVWASGNGGASFDNCNCDGYTNSIYTLSVGSTTERGTLPFYSEPCSAILTTTYSGGSFHHHRIVTTDLHQSCTSDHTGTSASAPLAAGIIALALEANPTLTWRDVQHLVVRASRLADLQTQDWRTNGVGRPVSHYYGYGLLDAGRLVDLASKWKAVKPQKKCTIDLITRAFELRMKLTLRWNVTACHGTRNWIRSLEHIQARLTLTYSRRGDLSITLISPKKTISNLLTTRPYDKTSAGFSDWAFMSTHCWDEDPSGYWVLQIENNGDSTNRGILLKFQLELHGTDERMIGRRIERAVVQQCAVRNSDGGCEECIYPLYVFENICLMYCPPHYYELNGNSTHSYRRCLPCHRNCHTCFGKQDTNCLDCPPYSTLDSRHSTCSPHVYPWDHRGKVTNGMDRTAAVLGILMGGPLVILCVMWAIAWMVSRACLPRGAARNQVDISTRHSSEESRDVEMVVFSITESQTENSESTSTFTNIPNTSRET